MALLLTLVRPAVSEETKASPEIQNAKEVQKQAEEAAKIEHETQPTATTAEPIECGIWLAKSTIPGSGLGMFAGRDFKPKEPMLESGDIVIPIVDIAINQLGDNDWEFLWDEYTWDSSSVLMEHEGLIEVNAASPGFGSAANCFLDLVNVDEWTPVSDTAGLNRREDPGAGGFSSYHDRISTANGYIKAGHELFVSYGSNWFKEREYMGPIPLKGDHPSGNALIQKFQRLKKELNESVNHVLNDMWQLFIMESPFRETSRLLNALPSSWEDMNAAMRLGLVQMRRQQHIVSPDWLQEHGTCMDNIRIDQSTIRQAGRGAFATRFLPKGRVVAPLPLIHVPLKRRFLTYDIGTDEKGKHYVKDQTRPSGTQLLRNYCMGHAKSSVLLCPYGALVTGVNHNRTLANIKLQWGDPKKTQHHPEWLNMSIASLASKTSAGLVMEYVATRDIEPGEELFLDYGEEWEEAWNEHVENWKPAEGAYDIRTAAEWNSDKEAVLRTVFEQLSDPYPDNVMLLCEASFRYGRRWKKHQEKNGTIRDFVKEMDEGRSDCDILHREEDEDGNILYTALMIYTHDNGEVEPGPKLHKVPREAFIFVDKPYKSDMHLPDAFRFEIMIPDEIFPEKWKNVVLKDTS